MSNKTFFIVLVAVLLSGCSHIQFGRDFDENGDELDQPSSPVASAEEASPAAKQAVVDKFDDDYYGEDEGDIAKKYDGKLNIASILVRGDVPPPYSDTRQQRMPGVWGGKESTPDSRAAEAEVLALFEASPSFSEILPKYLEKSFREQQSPVSTGIPTQKLVLEVVSWGLSDRIGLYSKNLRAQVTVIAELQSHSEVSVWQGTLTVKANEDDRPMADLSDFQQNPKLLGQHFEIAAKFVVHRVLSTLAGQPYRRPVGYDASRWVDIDE